jgi:putative ABC transport system substrate-binding protein
LPGLLFAGPDDGIRRIGVLATTADTQNEANQAFLKRLQELGYAEGRNLVVERRVIGGRESLDALVQDLLRGKVEVIVATATPAAQAAQRATKSIPIVFVAIVDPVGAGLTRNLARPDGNATGLSIMSTELSGKRLDLMREIVPGLARVAVLGNPGNPSNALQFTQLGEAAAKLNVRAELLQVKSRDDLEGALAAAARQRAEALVVLDDVLLYVERSRVVALANQHRIPAMYGFAEANALISYGTNTIEHYRRAAEYVDRILRGAKPADLPVEQPTRFELVVNLRVARTLQLTIPQSVLVRADRVIE